MTKKPSEKKANELRIAQERAFSFDAPCRFCVSVYGTERGPKVLRELIASLKAQTYPFERLLILCGSDASERAARRESAKDGRITCFRDAASLYAAEKESGCDCTVRISSPIPDGCLFGIRQAIMMRPEKQAFEDKANGVRALRGSAFSESADLVDCYQIGVRPRNTALTDPGNDALISAGMVVFNGDLEKVAANVENILPSVSRFFIVDNGSDDISSLEARFPAGGKVRFIRNGENKGIAFALNRALDAAAEEGFDWILTLDQDTLCDSGILNIYKRYIRMPNIGIISPFIIHRGKMSVEEFAAGSAPEIEFIYDFGSCITSAALTNVKAAKEIGGWNEELFIDAVDFDFNYRLMKAGYRILRANDTYIVQEIGERVPVKLYNLVYRFVGDHKYHGPKYFSVHSDFRLYYIARNYKWFLKKYRAKSPTVNRWANFKDMLLRFMLYPKGRSRIKMLRAVRRGRRDAKKMNY
ncbi:MAG: glycosyltransferase [Clostridia bacterium]|nr:glycosyltransferase [Clostridia bacterium]